MENNLLCYVQRSRITKWKRLVLTRDEPAFVYGSNDKNVFASRLRDGGVLWVVSSIPGRPPELVARLDVEMVRKRENPELGLSPRLLRQFDEYTWIAKGKTSSKFFGHNNAEGALLQSVFKPKNGAPWKIDAGATKWKGKYGQKFQSPRLICEEGEFEGGLISFGATPLKNLTRSQSRAVFLSWKWRDNKSAFMRSLAYELAARGIMPWLDLLAMPWPQEIGKREQEKPKLQRLLRYGFRHSVVVVAVDSENYGTPTGCNPNWTKREWLGELAPEKELKKIQYLPAGATPSALIKKEEVDLPILNKTPAEAAQKIKNWFDEQQGDNS